MSLFEEALAEAKVLGKRAAGATSMDELSIHNDARLKFIKLRTEFQGDKRRLISMVYYEQFEEKAR